MRPADEALLDRVRKLLALATSNHVHEAAAAAAAAQRLIAKHRLEAWLAEERAREVDPIVDARDAPLETAKRLRKWKIALAAGLAEANGCLAYTLAGPGREKSIVLVGRARDREAVHALWEWLVQRIEWLSATEGAGQPREWHDSFRIGAAATVAERVREVTAETAEQAPPGALVRLTAAMAAHQAALARFAEEELSLRPGRRLRVHAEAYARGRAAGAELPLPEE